MRKAFNAVVIAKNKVSAFLFLLFLFKLFSHHSCIVKLEWKNFTKYYFDGE